MTNMNMPANVAGVNTYPIPAGADTDGLVIYPSHPDREFAFNLRPTLSEWLPDLPIGIRISPGALVRHANSFLDHLAETQGTAHLHPSHCDAVMSDFLDYLRAKSTDKNNYAESLKHEAARAYCREVLEEKMTIQSWKHQVITEPEAVRQINLVLTGRQFEQTRNKRWGRVVREIKKAGTSITDDGLLAVVEAEKAKERNELIEMIEALETLRLGQDVALLEDATDED
jgi:hypothetical protein